MQYVKEAETHLAGLQKLIEKILCKDPAKIVVSFVTELRLEFENAVFRSAWDKNESSPGDNLLATSNCIFFGEITNNKIILEFIQAIPKLMRYRLDDIKHALQATIHYQICHRPRCWFLNCCKCGAFLHPNN